jgi:hypothetical protein
MDTVDLINDLWTWQFFAKLGIALLCGMLGGLVPHADSPAQSPQRKVQLRQGFVGAIAAAAILFVADPHTPTQLVSGSLVAGYAGNAVLAGLSARITATLAERDLKEIEEATGSLTNEVHAITRQASAALASPLASLDTTKIDEINKKIRNIYDRRKQS